MRVYMSSTYKSTVRTVKIISFMILFNELENEFPLTLFLAKMDPLIFVFCC